MSSDYMVRKRERAVFLGCRLKVSFEYYRYGFLLIVFKYYFSQTISDEYHEYKNKAASTSKAFYAVEGAPTPSQLLRSNSIQEELLTTF